MSDPVENRADICLTEHEAGRVCVLPKGHGGRDPVTAPDDAVATRLAGMRERLDTYGVIESGDYRNLLAAVEDVLGLHVKVRHYTSGSTDPRHVSSFIERCARCQVDTYGTWPCPPVAAIRKRLGGA